MVVLIFIFILTIAKVKMYSYYSIIIKKKNLKILLHIQNVYGFGVGTIDVNGVWRPLTSIQQRYLYEIGPQQTKRLLGLLALNNVDTVQAAGFLRPGFNSLTQGYGIFHGTIPDTFGNSVPNHRINSKTQQNPSTSSTSPSATSSYTSSN